MGLFGDGLLSRLKGKSKAERESPMSSLRAATRWAENLPLGDVLNSQRAITAELKRFNEQERNFSAEQLAALMLLDEKSRELQDTLVRQYLRNPRMAREVESQLWHTIYALEWELLLGYRAFVLNFSRSSGKCHYEREVTRAALRGILHYGTLMKWRALRYLTPSERMWQRLHALYSAMEAENLHRNPVQAYPDDKFQRTIETAYVNILMLDLVNSGTFYPRQIDLIDRWLEKWNVDYALTRELQAEQTVFAVDLAADAGPKRARNPAPDKPMRYWSSEPVLGYIRKSSDLIREGAAPSALGLSEDVRTSECQGLLEHLQRQWATESSREQRRSPRVEVKRLYELAHGLNDVLEVLDGIADPGNPGSFYDEAQDMQVYGFVTRRTRERKRNADQDAPRIERWVMQDESACGFGATVETQNRDWLRVGVLVAVRTHEEAAWRVGVIRRLTRNGPDAFSVGIEVISDSVTAVDLSDGNTSNYTIAGDGYQGAERPHEVLLAQRKNEATTLLLDPICFQPDRVWTLHTPAGPERIRITSPIQHGEGWLEAAYQAL